MTAIAHITHEAVEKVGGIGAVLQGLLTSRAYREAVERSILVGPLFDPTAAQPLGPQGVLLYDRLAGVRAAAVATALEEVESDHEVRLVYGRRPLSPGVTAEVLLVDVARPPRRLSGFKHELYKRFGLTSDRYEADPEYEQYVRLAGPAFDAISRLVPAPSPCCIVAHEFMGLPTAFRSILSGDPRFATLFHAHEVATVRRIVEGSPGQDVMFYNALRAAAETGAGLEEVFGSQDDYFKHALVRRAWHCDKVLAVGDLVLQELAFLGSEFRSDPPVLVYNGVESEEITPGDRMSARRRLAEFAERLLGFRPDYVFAHVSRLVESKGLWRDLLVCRALDEILVRGGRSAVLVVLATAAGRREAAAVRRMAAEYGWPLVHREGFPDLAGGEEDFDEQVRRFNARSRAVKVVFVNQFGIDPDSWGGGMPGIDFSDLRQGTDAEFGQSIYEPFGIAQIEPIGFGSLSVVSDVCGCLGFLQASAGEGGAGSGYIRADYTRLDRQPDLAGALEIGADARRQAEEARSREAARQLAELLRLAGDHLADNLRRGYEIASKMSWERVAGDYFLPVVQQLER